MTTLTCTCDLCFARGGRYVEAVYRRVRVRINDDLRGILDLCEAHHEQLLLPVIEAIEDRREDDAELGDPNRKFGPVQCKVPGCGAVLKHTGTLWQHLQGKHDKMTIADYRATYGDPQPLTPEEEAAIVVEAKCEVDGCGQVYSTELGHRYPQSALVSHLWGRHQIRKKKSNA